MEKIYELLWNLSCKFVAKKGLHSEFAAFAVNYMLDKLKMSSASVSDILKVIKE